MKKSDRSVYFYDGVVARKDYICLLTFPNALQGEDSEYSLLLTAQGNTWGGENINFDARSVVAMTTGKEKGWWVVGKRGEVIMINRGIKIQEKIDEAGTGKGKQGYLNKLALIDGELYICGYHRQVYKRKQGKWITINDQIMSPKDEDETASFESMDGLNEKFIYTVGNGGEIWHFNGTKWSQIDSPTDSHLNEVKVLEDGTVLAVGHKGVVVQGKGDSWQAFSDDEFSEDLWGVEYYHGKIYLSGYGGLGTLEEGEIKPLDLKLGRNILGYRLRTGGGQLWSIGNDDLACFNGKKWKEIIYPENVKKK